MKTKQGISKVSKFLPATVRFLVVHVTDFPICGKIPGDFGRRTASQRRRKSSTDTASSLSDW